MTDPFAELKAKQGAGARYDAPAAPSGDLLLARRGTAFLSRKINELSDADLDLENRRRTIAQVSYDARAQAITLSSLRQGHPTEGIRLSATAEEILHGMSLPSRALRHLFHHTCVHLNVEWRDLSAVDWSAALPDGTLVSSLPRLRARAVWQSALFLKNGARSTDIPQALRPL